MFYIFKKGVQKTWFLSDDFVLRIIIEISDFKRHNKVMSAEVFSI